MPVWVRGNIASNKLVLYLHGGPGDCSICYRDYLQTIDKEPCGHGLLGSTYRRIEYGQDGP